MKKILLVLGVVFAQGVSCSDNATLERDGDRWYITLNVAGASHQMSVASQQEGEDILALKKETLRVRERTDEQRQLKSIKPAPMKCQKREQAVQDVPGIDEPYDLSTERVPGQNEKV